MKYYVVSFCGQVPCKQYDITPLSWILSKEVTWFPLYERGKLETLVESLQQPLPKKDFKKYDIKILHSTDDFDWALEVVRRLEDSDDYIDDIIRKMDEEREAQEAKRRPRRTCAPSVKAVERAALPTDDSEITDCSEWEDICDRPRRQSSWKKNMAAIYKYCDNTKVVLSLHGGQAVQYMSDASIRNYGIKMLQTMEEDAAAMASGKFDSDAPPTPSADAGPGAGCISKKTVLVSVPGSPSAIVPSITEVADEPGTTRNFNDEEPGPSRNIVAEQPGPSRNIDAEQPGPSRNMGAEELGPSRNVVADAPGPSEADLRPSTSKGNPGKSSAVVDASRKKHAQAEASDSDSDFEIGSYQTQAFAGRTPGALKRAVHEMSKEAKSKSKKKRLDFRGQTEAETDPPLPDFPETLLQENKAEQAPPPVNAVSQAISGIQSLEEAEIGELDTAFNDGTPLTGEVTGSEPSTCAGSKAFEKHMLQYIVAIHRNVKELTREVNELKRAGVHGSTSSLASSQGGVDSPRQKIPCSTKQELQALEERIEMFPHAFRELVELLTVTGQDCTVGKSVGCFVSQAVDRVVDKRILACMSWQGTANKWPFSAFENIVDAIIKATQASYAKEGQATDEIVLKKIKKKLGNNSYWSARSERQLTGSPATPKQRRKTVD